MTTPFEIYRVEQLPVFQNRMFRTREDAIACPKGDVVLVQDSLTGLISNRAFDPSLMVYDADYQNEQAVSAIFSTHLDKVAEIVQRQFTGASLIEVGCGKGHFLERLESLGFSVTGFDPTYEGEHTRIAREYFGQSSGIQADGIILRHVLEHVADPVSFLQGIVRSNGGHGKIYIEVPCLDWIARSHAWFDIFYEHVNYFRAQDLHAMFGRVYEAGKTFDGQYLYVVADLATLRIPRRLNGDEFQLPKEFLVSLEHCSQLIARNARDAESAFAVWGGASKGVIFALLMQRRGAPVDILIDINPAKQGRFVAATGLLVQSPNEAAESLKPGATVFVMNSNYLQEIRAMSGNRYNYLTVEHEAGL